MPPVTRPLLFTLLFGNFVIGTGVLLPAGLIHELSRAFGVDVAAVGSLIAYGGALLCIQSPLMALITNRLDRRSLLVGALLLFALGHGCSALAPNFSFLLAARLVMIAGAAVFTPQAATTLALLIPAPERAGAIAFIFLGWSLTSAIGIPLVNLLGSLIGWQAVYLLLAVGCTLAALGVALTLPAGLKPHRLSPSAWLAVFANRRIWLILAVSGCALTGQFIKYPFLVVEIREHLAADAWTTSALLAVYGCAGLLGTLLSTRVVNRLGVRITVSLWLGVIFVGLTAWSTVPALLPLAAATLFLWGSGLSPAIAAQQARLVEADPAAASASVAMNTSVVYLGQALGTSVGGQLLMHGRLFQANCLALAFLAAGLLVSVLIARRPGI